LPLLGSSRRRAVGPNQDSPDPEGPHNQPNSSNFLPFTPVRVTRCRSLLPLMLDFAVLYSHTCRSLLPASRQPPDTAAKGLSLRGTMISAKQAYEAAPAPISREVGDAFAVVEPHVPRRWAARICRASVTSRGSGASTAMSEVPASASSKYSWLINASSWSRGHPLLAINNHVAVDVAERAVGSEVE
jgi:hypothetical protein